MIETKTHEVESHKEIIVLRATSLEYLSVVHTLGFYSLLVQACPSVNRLSLIADAGC